MCRSEYAANRDMVVGVTLSPGALSLARSIKTEYLATGYAVCTCNPEVHTLLKVGLVREVHPDEADRAARCGPAFMWRYVVPTEALLIRH